jgi:toxin ParE1/3/4
LTRKNITEPALLQIEEIYRYIARDSVQGALNVTDAIYRTIDLLVLHPRTGHRAVRRSRRMFAVPDYPYLIYYQYLPRCDELRVFSVRHAARRRTVELREPAAEFRV